MDWRKPLIVAAIAASFAAATGAHAARDLVRQVLSKYERTGETVDCIQIRNIRDTRPLSDYVMFVRATGGAFYINEFQDRCFNLGREQRYVHRTTVPRLCKGDTIQVLDSSGSRGSTCVIGAFDELVEIPDGE